jgi:hypothetical protein
MTVRTTILEQGGEHARVSITSQVKGGGRHHNSSELWQANVSSLIWLWAVSGVEVLLACRQVLFVQVHCWIRRVLGGKHNQSGWNRGNKE